MSERSKLPARELRPRERVRDETRRRARAAFLRQAEGKGNGPLFAFGRLLAFSSVSLLCVVYLLWAAEVTVRLRGG